ncbi:MAG: hypothetical protein RBS39_06460 [Phycisphaerales bacterium]|jgi:hypothetical protein|nr:hypothetical protein [Phycisphaerales bacterium]
MDDKEYSGPGLSRCALADSRFVWQIHSMTCRPSHSKTISEVAHLVSPSVLTPAVVIQTYDDAEWEQFALQWANAFDPPYAFIDRVGGTGDKGRDIVAFTDRPNSACDLDVYQCKHFDHPIQPNEIWLELGKLCLFTYRGAHDDGPDALEMAVRIAQRPGPSSASTTRKPASSARPRTCRCEETNTIVVTLHNLRTRLCLLRFSSIASIQHSQHEKPGLQCMGLQRSSVHHASRVRARKSLSAVSVCRPLGVTVGRRERSGPARSLCPGSAANVSAACIGPLGNLVAADDDRSQSGCSVTGYAALRFSAQLTLFRPSCLEV